MRKLSILLLTLGTLFGALIFQYRGEKSDRPLYHLGDLNNAIPIRSGSLIGTDLPIGETEVASLATEEILEYDDFTHRDYKLADKVVNVFVLYWAKGKVQPRKVAFHTPDHCWVGIGFERESYVIGKQYNGTGLRPAQERLYSYGHKKIHVAYWHIVGDETVVYNPLGPPSDLSLIKEVFNGGVFSPPEQFFVRISSEQPLDYWMQNSDFLDLMNHVAHISNLLLQN